MDRAHDLQNPKTPIVNQSPMPKRIFPHNELNQKNYNHSKASNNTNNKKFNTDPLDDAMKELLDICQLYNDKLSIRNNKEQHTEEKKDSSLVNNKSSSVREDHNNKSMTTNNCDIKRKINTNSNGDSQQYISDSTSNCSGSIERLQQKQSELQSQLDEVLQVAKSLALRQKRKLKCILEDQDEEPKSRGTVEESEEEEEDELIEFQQIENELRISELNRQLDNIQEELRIRLYKRLLSNANNGSKPLQNLASSVHYPTTRQGSHTDESSPSSSSCSDEPTASSISAADINILSNAEQNVVNEPQNPSVEDVTDSFNSGEVRSNRYSESTIRSQFEQGSTIANNEFSYSSKIEQYSMATSSSSTNTLTNTQSDLDSAVDNMLDHEVLTPTTSKESVESSSTKRSPPAELSNAYSNCNTRNMTNIPSVFQSTYTTSPVCSNNHRNNSANSDLERIEEDEEDCPDYYGGSDRFRTIYEEKLSPIIYSSSTNGNRKFIQKRNDTIYESQQPKILIHAQDGYMESCRATQEDDIQHCNEYSSTDNSSVVDRVTEPSNSHNSSFSALSNSAGKLTSRPLTLYMPKPDEEIDLVDHIQALGHDLNIISSDLRLSSTCAYGYLWKSCSNNTKKWLKRYFYFNRSLKILSYYDNEGQLVKKNSSPKSCIKFDEICDVYVDHKLSGIGEKDRTSKRKNYVFVLATVGRKYLLASSKAETMRAWIDILFTAAKADDYFQLAAIEDDAADECQNSQFAH